MTAINKTLGLAIVAALGWGPVASAALLPVCQRTAPIKAFLEQTLRKTCENITAEDLATVKRVAVGHKQITAFQADDFSGLTNLEVLNIRSNPFTTMPEGLLKDNVRLKTLVIISGDLRYYPDDFLEHNPEVTHLHLFRNKVRSISESIFQRLENAKGLKELDFDESLQTPEKERLQKLFPEGGAVQLSLIGR